MKPKFCPYASSIRIEDLGKMVWLCLTGLFFSWFNFQPERKGVSNPQFLQHMALVPISTFQNIL